MAKWKRAPAPKMTSKRALLRAMVRNIQNELTILEGIVAVWETRATRAENGGRKRRTREET